MRKSTRVVLLAAFCLVFGSLVHAESYDFANNTNKSIHFDGSGGFYFGATDADGIADSHITTASVGLGSLVGLDQDIGGTFTIGAITTSGPIQTASVSGTGSYKIWAGPSDFLLGTITWIDITTLGGGGTLNLNGILNVNYGGYGGTNAGLQYLASKAGTAKVTFQLDNNQNLTYLKATAFDTSFSGRVTNIVPDGGTTLILLGGALMGLTTLRRKFRV